MRSSQFWWGLAVGVVLAVLAQTLAIELDSYLGVRPCQDVGCM